MSGWPHFFSTAQPGSRGWTSKPVSGQPLALAKPHLLRFHNILQQLAPNVQTREPLGRTFQSQTPTSRNNPFGSESC